MLEEPDLSKERLAAQVQREYGLQAERLEFLPLGADAGTAVYRCETPGGAAYFLKLRQGVFDELSVLIPDWLQRQGNAAVIPALETATGRLWGRLEPYTLVLYPFIAGQDGYAQNIGAQNWLDLGRSLRAIHAARLPAGLLERLPRETFSPRFRRRLRGFLAQVQNEQYDDPLAAALAAFMRRRRSEITHLIQRAAQLGRELQTRPLEPALCHGDLHPGNLHLAPGGRLYLVDWDNLILAPKEHDLMFIGAGMGIDWQSGEAEAHFYRGYGPAQLDRLAIAYYRFERIIQDLAVECELILLSAAGEADREREYGFFTANFRPGGEYEQALAADAP